MSGWRGCQLRRYPGSTGCHGSRDFQVGEASQFRGNLPCQPVAIEHQAVDPSARIISDTVPFPDWQVAQPVSAVRPIRSVCCVVKLDQHRPVLRRVRQCAAAASDEGYALEPCLECLIDRRAKPCIVMEVKRLQRRQSCQTLGKRSSQLVVIEPQHPQVGEASPAPPVSPQSTGCR